MQYMLTPLSPYILESTSPPRAILSIRSPGLDAPVASELYMSALYDFAWYGWVIFSWSVQGLEHIPEYSNVTSVVEKQVWRVVWCRRATYWSWAIGCSIHRLISTCARLVSVMWNTNGVCCG